MIELTKLSNEPLWLNPLVIRSIESTPDSIICLTDGTRIPVREAAHEISQRMMQFWKGVYAKQEPGA